MLTSHKIYLFLTESKDKHELIRLLELCTGFTKQYCELALEENQLDFLKTYKQIIEHQLKKTLCN